MWHLGRSPGHNVSLEKWPKGRRDYFPNTVGARASEFLTFPTQVVLDASDYRRSLLGTFFFLSGAPCRVGVFSKILKEKTE